MANILIALVIVMFLSTAVYVGYYASQNVSEEIGGHSISIDLKILETSPELLQIIEKQDGYQSII
jgi:hypothetical protein